MALQCIPFVWIDEFMHSFVWKYYVRITFEIWNRHYNSCHMCVWFVTIILDFRANDELTLQCNVTLLQAGKPLALERRVFFRWDLHECKRHCMILEAVVSEDLWI